AGGRRGVGAEQRTLVVAVATGGLDALAAAQGHVLLVLRHAGVEHALELVVAVEVDLVGVDVARRDGVEVHVVRDAVAVGVEVDVQALGVDAVVVNAVAALGAAGAAVLGGVVAVAVVVAQRALLARR